MIRPRDTQRVDFIFKSEVAGIKTELWQLHTHPVLLQAASMQVTLKGLAQYQDRTADQRLFLQVVYGCTVYLNGRQDNPWTDGTKVTMT